ncbi:hypothetical protein G0Q06_12920 [Puniceicoccales bacterium CK1056]|uniref:Uncharacterized protein n=1 Tax=Oceanipulchritudo coccoides TaxID=2706888 RepID=A0A6B2M6T1_9BACT|nr:hypothetical protein [Oceanipulchritudo coccoides]NDV63360.1 hypothetical protein [Oceanipulchritudo coccoides]
MKSSNDLISSIGDDVSSDDLDSFLAVSEENRKFEKLKQVLDSWSETEDQDRDLRKRYAGYLVIFLLIQLFVIDVGFFFIGFNIIDVSPWVANTFIVSSFAEISGMVYLIVRYLFPDSKTKLLDLINQL